MKKTTILSILGLTMVAAVFLTAFSVKNAPQSDTDVTFEQFLMQFPAKSLPYTLDENSLVAGLNKSLTADRSQASYRSLEQPKKLKHQYFKFLPNLSGESSFNRLPIAVEPIAILATADNFAVLYSINRSFSAGFRTYNIAVLNKKGKQISCNVVGNVLPQNIVSCTVSAELMAELKTWKPIWKLDFDENGSVDNMITDISLVESQTVNLMAPTPEFVSPYSKRERIAPIVPLDAPTTEAGIKSK